MNYQLSNGLERLFLLVGVPSPKVSLAWTEFHNSTTGETVGLTVSNRRTVGFKRVKKHRIEIDFRTVTEEQLNSLVGRHCPYVKQKPQQVENEVEGVSKEVEGKEDTEEAEEQAQDVTEVPKPKRKNPSGE